MERAAGGRGRADLAELVHAVLRVDEPTARAYNQLHNLIRAERSTGDPPLDVEATTNLWRGVPSFVEVHAWAAWEAGRLAGMSAGLISRYEQNQHLVALDLAVRPDRRRQGLGCRLLLPVVEAGIREGRTMLRATTRVPVGAGFAERIGLRLALASVTNELRLGEPELDRLRAGAAPPSGAVGEFALEEIVGSCPPEQRDEVAGAWHLLNDAPRDDLSYEDDLLTAEQLREFDERRAAGGVEQLTMLVRRLTDRRIAGFAHLLRNTAAPTVVRQDGLALERDSRGRGLGRWLESASLLRAAELWPGAERVRTDQARSNRGTLGLLYGVGFTVAQEFSEWEAELTELRDRLAARN